MLILEYIKAKGKGHEPSRKSFSSSYGSSQLGSVSSLATTALDWRSQVKFIFSLVRVKIIDQHSLRREN